MREDPYSYAGTNVLKNKLGIEDAQQAKQFEAAASSVRLAELKVNPIKGDYDLAHLQAIHKHTFKDVYEWAGQVRDVELAKGKPAERSLFTFTEKIESYAANVSSDIRTANYFKGLPKEEWAEKMAKTYADINTLHPFREGNGRVTRVYMGELAKEAGYALDYSRTDKNTWNQAAIQSFRGNPEPMKEVFQTMAVPERAIAFERLPQKEALAKHPELDGAYQQLHAARSSQKIQETNTLAPVEKSTSTFSALAQKLGIADNKSQDRPIVGQDEKDRVVSDVRARLSESLRAGDIPKGDVTVRESRIVIEEAASNRQLSVREPKDVVGEVKGSVVAQSSHHVLVKIGETVAVRFDKENLDRGLQNGERVAISFNQSKSIVRDQAEPVQQQSQAQGKSLELGGR